MRNAPTTDFTFISPKSRLDGNVISGVGIACWGEVSGSIICTSGLLHIGPGAIVEGNVAGRHVRIDGCVEGNVKASESLAISGRVKGDILYSGSIELGPQADLGGTIQRCPTIDLPEAPPKLTAPQASSTTQKVEQEDTRDLRLAGGNQIV